MVAANQDGESATPYTALPSQSNTANDSGSDSGAARKQILSACIAVFLVQYSQSQAMIAPFFPTSIPAGIIGPDWVGVVFSAYPLATALATPLPPLAIRRYGLRGTVMLGLTITAVANLAFGVAGTMATDAVAPHLGLVLTAARALGGVGAALSESGCLTAVSSAGWGAHLGKALSAVEVTTGTGAAIGAMLSGWLYPLGGFFLPMLVGAVLPLLVLPVAHAYLPAETRADTRADNAGESTMREAPLLPDAATPAHCDDAPNAATAGHADGTLCARRLARAATCCSLVLAAAVFEGLNPLLEPHLKRAPYGLDVTTVGLVRLAARHSRAIFAVCDASRAAVPARAGAGIPHRPHPHTADTLARAVCLMCLCARRSHSSSLQSVSSTLSPRCRSAG